MSELTPEQQAELALVRAIADSLRRRMPDLGDRTLGRVAFHIADLLNGVAVVLTTDADSNLPANWERPRPRPIDASRPTTGATAQPPAPYPGAPATGDFPVQRRVPPTTGEYPVAGRPGRPSGEFPAQPPVRPAGEYPAAPPLDATTEMPAIRPTGEFPAVRPAGEFPAAPATGEFSAVRPTTEFPAVPATGEFPAVRPTGEFPAARPTGEFPAVRSTGEYPAVRPTGEFPAVRPAGESSGTRSPGAPRIRFPASRSRRPETPAFREGVRGDALAEDALADPPKGPWIAEFFQLDGTPLEQAEWAERDQALRGVAGRIRWLAFDGTEVTVRLRGPGGIDMDHEAVLAAIDRMRRG